MSGRLLFWLALLAASLGFCVVAWSPAVAAESDAAFLARLHAKFPATVGAKVAPSFAGFWSVVRGQDVTFVRDDLSVVVSGEVVDVASGRALQAELREANRPRADVSLFDRRDAIVMGSGSRRLYVFSDPDCPYCKRLDGELAKLRDVEVWLFPYPLAGLHPGAVRASVTLWCQRDPGAAWRAYEAGGSLPSAVSCANPVVRNVALGGRLGVTGTPTLVFPDGVMVAGALSAGAIESRLGGK